MIINIKKKIVASKEKSLDSSESGFQVSLVPFGTPVREKKEELSLSPQAQNIIDQIKRHDYARNSSQPQSPTHFLRQPSPSPTLEEGNEL